MTYSTTLTRTATARTISQIRGPIGLLRPIVTSIRGIQT